MYAFLSATHIEIQKLKDSKMSPFINQCLIPVFVILSSGLLYLQVDSAESHLETAQSGKFKFNFPDKNQGK